MTHTSLFTCAMAFLLAAQATPSKRAEVTKSPRQRAFEGLDKDGDGVLSEHEFLGGSLGKAAEQKRQTFHDLDADQSGSLDFSEFAQYRKPPPTREELEKDFTRRDADKDGKITLTEFVGSRTGSARAEARRFFVRLDGDSDEVLTKEEFLRRGQPVALTTLQEFKLRDGDDDGKLTREEFVAPLVGKKWYESATANFPRYDLNHDSFLDQQEFAATPGRKPNDETVFRALDQDEDGFLSAAEFVASASEKQRPARHRDFYQADENEDERLTLDEFLLLPSQNPSPDRLLQALDRDGDGCLNYEEFMAIVTDTARRRKHLEFLVRDRDGERRLTSDEFVLTPGQRPDRRQVFAALDRNADGALQFVEFRAITLDRQLRQVREEFVWRDRNADRSLDVTEFEAPLDRRPLSPSEEFRVWDIDEDGWVTRNELTMRRKSGQAQEDEDETVPQWHLAQEVKEEEWFLVADQDGDGRISPSEYTNARNAESGMPPYPPSVLTPLHTDRSTYRSHRWLDELQADDVSFLELLLVDTVVVIWLIHLFLRKIGRAKARE